MSHPFLGFNHVGVSVPDVYEAVEWYSKHLQFRLLKGPIHFKRNKTLNRQDDAHIFQSEH